MEATVLAAICSLSGGVVTAVVMTVGKKYFQSKKEDAETIKLLTENKKLTMEAQRFIEAAVDERDRNIQLKIQGFQKELLNGAEDNYKMKRELLMVKNKLDEREQQYNQSMRELDEERRVRKTCVERLNHLEKTLNIKREDHN